MNETRDLAAFISTLTYDDLTPEAVDYAIRAIRDTVSVALFARSLEWVTIVADYAREVAGDGRSSVWGTEDRLSAPYAALVNGAAAHGIEMDDRHHLLELHNGAAAVPAALALAESEGRSGRDLLVAVVGGYEVAFRMARATRKTIDRFYWVSVRNIFGGAAAAARVLDLDTTRTQWAWGIAGGMASGLWEFKNDPLATMVKRIQGGGWPAHCGVTAALLARRGLSAPGTIFEGEYGVCRTFSTAAEPNLAALTNGLGDGFEMVNWETKAYAAWGGAHSCIEAVRDLAAGHGLAIEDIASVTAGVSAGEKWHSGTGRPASVMAAQNNLAFLIAASFRYDMSDPGIWESGILADQQVEELRQRVQIEVDPGIDRVARGDRGYAGARLGVTTGDSRRFSKRIIDAKGTPGNPFSRAELDEKFYKLASRALTRPQLKLLDDYLANLPEQKGPLDLRSIWGG